MKTVALYCNRNVGMVALFYILAKGYKVKLISNDFDVLWFEPKLDVEPVTFNTVGDFDLFLCVHGTKILSKEFLSKGICVNVHPNLPLYKGKDPIARYIMNKDRNATVDSHYMTEVVDEGEVIHSEKFTTPFCSTYADFYNVALPYYGKVIEKTLEKVFA